MSKTILRYRLYLQISSVALVLLGSYLNINDIFFSVGIASIFTGIILFKDILPTVRISNDENIFTIFRGFNYKMATLFGIGWVALAYWRFSGNDNVGYLCYSLVPVILVVDQSFRFVIFDFNARTISGYFSTKKHDMGSVTITYLQEAEVLMSDRDDSFKLLRTDYDENMWTQLKTNFDKVKNWP